MKATDCAWLGGLAGGEAGVRYKKVKSKVTVRKKTYVYYYWRLQMRIEMGEEDYVKRVAELCGVSYRKEPNGKYWEVVLRGGRALGILKLIRPYLFGLKREAVDIALRLGPSVSAKLSRPLLPSIRGGNRTLETSLGSGIQVATESLVDSTMPVNKIEAAWLAGLFGGEGACVIEILILNPLERHRSIIIGV